MKRLIPTSLLGQVMTAATLALLVAQIVSAALLFRASEERREVAVLTGLAFQLSNGAEFAERPRRARVRRRPTPAQGPVESLIRPRIRLPRQLRYIVSDSPPASSTDIVESNARRERLLDMLAADGVAVHQMRIVERRAGDDPALAAFAASRPRLAARSTWRKQELHVASIQREPGGVWETARVFEPPRPSGGPAVLAFQTLVIFAFLLTILYLVLRRITRPLQQLTARVADFSRTPSQAMPMEETGPSDTRRLIAAHNTMEARISTLLDEKDVMLGAIGHDLKTPLAALRVRIESVPNEAQRARMADSIEDITRTLDDILELARIGRAGRDSTGEREAVDLSALAESIVEEFEDLGEPVTFAPPAKRIVAQIQETWTKRAFRNLVSNAVRYGGSARVSLHHDGSDSGADTSADAAHHVTVRIDDDGPGIPAGEIEGMLEPFKRGETSRNRSTGGAGLGLTVARAIATAHGGELVLANRTDGGLRAEIKLPLDQG